MKDRLRLLTRKRNVCKCLNDCAGSLESIIAHLQNRHFSGQQLLWITEVTAKGIARKKKTAEVVDIETTFYHVSHDDGLIYKLIKVRYVKTKLLSWKFHMHKTTQKTNE